MSKQLFVGNLAFSTTEEELREAFSAHGKVTEVKIPMDRATGRPRGFAFIGYESPESLNKAIDALNGKELKGRAIRVSVAEEKKNSSR